MCVGSVWCMWCVLCLVWCLVCVVCGVCVLCLVCVVCGVCVLSQITTPTRALNLSAEDKTATTQGKSFRKLKPIHKKSLLNFGARTRRTVFQYCVLRLGIKFLSHILARFVLSQASVFFKRPGLYEMHSIRMTTFDSRISIDQRHSSLVKTQSRETSELPLLPISFSSKVVSQKVFKPNLLPLLPFSFPPKGVARSRLSLYSIC